MIRDSSAKTGMEIRQENRINATRKLVRYFFELLLIFNLFIKLRGSATEWSFRCGKQTKELLQKNKLLHNNSIKNFIAEETRLLQNISRSLF